MEYRRVVPKDRAIRPFAFGERRKRRTASELLPFPEYDEHYFRGLTAEEQVVKVVRGYRKLQWVKRYERNEPLDCRVYARAAAAILGLDRLSPQRLAQMGGATAKRESRAATKTAGAVGAVVFGMIDIPRTRYI